MEGYENVYDYLVDTYGKDNVREVNSNGSFNGVYSVNLGGDKLYVNSSTSLNDVNIVASFPGCGNGDDADIRGLMSSENPPNYWVLESHSKNAYNVLGNIANDSNLNVSNIDISLFSASGNSVGSFGGLNGVADFIDNNPSCAGKVTVMSTEGSYLSQSVSDHAVNVLKENEIPILVVGGSGGTGNTQSPRHVLSLSEKGLDVSYLRSTDKGHASVLKTAFENGVPEYMMGLSGSITNDDRSGYTASRYNPETGQLESIELNDINGDKGLKRMDDQMHYSVGLTPDDIKRIKDYSEPSDPYVDDKLEYSIFLNPEDLKIISELSNSSYPEDFISEIMGEFLGEVVIGDATIKKEHEGLRDLSSLSIRSSSIISSDYNYVVNSMNNIRNSISSSSFLSGRKVQFFSSNTGIPGGLNKYINAYYDMVGDLLNKLKEETEAIVSIAQGMIDMDTDLNRRHEEYLGAPRNGLFGRRMGKSIEKVDVVSIVESTNDKLNYFESKDGNNLYIQKPGSYTISVPKDYIGQDMNLIIFSDAAKTGSLRTRGEKAYYAKDNTGKLNAQEDILDAINANNSNTIVATTYFGVSSKEMEEMLNVLDSLKLNSDNVVVSGWSAGGNEALYITNEIVNNHENLGTPQVLLIDCNHTNQVDNSVFENLKENDVKCTLMTSLEQKHVEDKLSKLMDNDVELDVINLGFESENSNHIERERIAIYNNMFGYLLGEEETPSSEYDDVVYTFQNYNYENNSLDEK